MGRGAGLIAAAALLATWACSGGDDSSVDDEPVAPASTSVPATAPATTASMTAGPASSVSVTAVDPDSDLECERNGYPCSVAQVPVEILRRSHDLATDAHRRLDGGVTMDDVAEWLAGLDDVAEVEGDASAVWFRVDGGTGLWLLGDGLEGTRGAPGAIGATDAAPRPSGAFTGPVSGPEHVVAPGEEIKRALVLAPVLYQFANTDDAPVVADLLEGTTDYAGNVDYRGNATVTSTDVSLDEFESWDDYDVVHVSTHGKRICAQEPCRGMIVAGPLDAVLPPGPGDLIDKIAGLDLLDRPGVGISIARSGNGYVILSADFFRSVYPGGLVDTFVFINACQTLGSGQTDIAEAVTGTTSVFVGWSEVVGSIHALDAAAALYTDMAEHGVTADEAFARLDAGLVVGDRYQDHDPPVLQLLDRADGDHLRIREVVELLQPGTDDPVELAEVPIDGTIGDGEPDAVPYRVRVDGHDELQAADAVVHVSVDGVVASPRSVDEGTPDGAGRWTLDGTIELGYDLDSERDATLRAWVELPDGGESFDEENATLVGEPLMGTRWEMTATHTGQFTNLPSTPETVTGTLSFVFADGQAKDEPRPRYVLEGGTVHIDFNHTYGDCVYTADPITYEVEPAEFSVIEFDTTTSPVRYRGYAITQSPWFTRVDDCGDGPTAREHRTLTAWLDRRDEWQPITDATTIVGQQEHQDGCCYVRRSEFTIIRVD